MNAEGFEPSTACLEGRCSIQLSYASNIVVSGWQDSNLRPPAPKAGAITGLRYTPKSKIKSGETGTRTLATIARRQISNLLHYHSGTSPSSKNVSYFAVANVAHHCINNNYFIAFFTFIFRFKLNQFTIKRVAIDKIPKIIPKTEY